MDLTVPLDGRGDRVARVYRALREAVTAGRLRPGDRLPSTRALAADLGVSRNSVAAAYERLVAEGYLEGRVGAGTFVTAGASPRRPTRSPGDPVRPRSGWTFEPTRTSAGQEPRYDFRVGIPDAALFPFDTWRRLVTAELRQRAHSPGTYAEPAGHLPLREAITRHVAYSRSVRTDPEDVLVTNGTQHALDLLARVLLEPGEVVAVEEPGYPPARALFASYGARVVGVPVDTEGLIVDAIPPTARLVYTTPSHQFPTGVPMSLDRRLALLERVRDGRTAVVEDDYDSEFRFSPRPLEPLHTLGDPGRVIYVGTFSKSMLPSLRTGFLIAPRSLRSALRAARQLGDGHGQVAMQAALARFIDDGQLARHVRRATRAYELRRAAVLAGVQGLEVLPSAAGLHVTALLRNGDPAVAARVANAAAAQGIALETLAGYCHAAARAGFVLGYGAVQTDRVTEGMDRVAALLRSTS